MPLSSSFDSPASLYFFLSTIGALCAVPYLAKIRRKSLLAWLILSIIVTPLVSFVILYFIQAEPPSSDKPAANTRDEPTPETRGDMPPGPPKQPDPRLEAARVDLEAAGAAAKEATEERIAASANLTELHNLLAKTKAEQDRAMREREKARALGVKAGLLLAVLEKEVEKADREKKETAKIVEDLEAKKEAIEARRLEREQLRQERDASDCEADELRGQILAYMQEEREKAVARLKVPLDESESPEDRAKVIKGLRWG